MKNILNYLSTQIVTCLTNNIREHFIQHFFRFINLTTKNITEEKSELFKFKNQLLKLDKNTDKKFDEWKLTHIHHIFPEYLMSNIYIDLKFDPFNYLKGMLYMNSVLEKEGHKLFQPLPLRTDIIPKHFILDTASLISFFYSDLYCSEENVIKTKLLKNITKNQEDVWSKFLNFNHKIFRKKNYKFNYQIQTDGFSCSLLFIRKDMKEKKTKQIREEQEFSNIEDLSKKELEKLKNRKIIGCDPGKRSLVYMIDEDGNKLQYTAPQRKRESKSKRNQYILQKEKEKYDIMDKETKLSSKNSKTVDYEKFKDYLKEKYKLNKETIEFYKKEIWRKMKFRVYSYGKKSIDNFLNKIEDTFGNNPLIAYGNWSRSTQMKYIAPTMNKGLRKLIHKRFETITIDERYTSKKCCECHKDLINCKDNDGNKIHRLQKCVSCKNEKIVFRTRDVNSAINIMNLAKLWITKQERPKVFQRIQLTSST